MQARAAMPCSAKRPKPISLVRISAIVEGDFGVIVVGQPSFQRIVGDHGIARMKRVIESQQSGRLLIERVFAQQERFRLKCCHRRKATRDAPLNRVLEAIITPEEFVIDKKMW